MSTQRAERIPKLTLGWRLKMALGDEYSVQEMADYLGVSRATLSRWMADKGAPPKRAYVAQWALKTDVPMRWLEEGIEPHGPDDGSSTLVRSYRSPLAPAA
jgi:transcriptional regulator with XRE-family HTH domain